MTEKARVLVVGVGNVLRGDDMFGVEVSRRLEQMKLPPSVRVTETGIAGISFVQELMDGYEAVLLIDAVERGKPPGTLVLLEPKVPEPSSLTSEQRREFFSDLHQADPSIGLMLAKALGHLPEKVRVLGCEVGDADELYTDMTPPVAAAVPKAIKMALETLREWLGADLEVEAMPA
ncbi:MAG: hydrogenase maturation protease [Candidatus Dormibacteria bacterium]